MAEGGGDAILSYAWHRHLPVLQPWYKCYCLHTMVNLLYLFDCIECCRLYTSLLFIVYVSLIHFYVLIALPVQ